MPNIVEFLAHLSRDQAAYKAFKANPDGAMADYGLDPVSQINVIKGANGKPVGSGEVTALEKAIQSEYAATGAMATMTTKLSY